MTILDGLALGLALLLYFPPEGKVHDWGVVSARHRAIVQGILLKVAGR